MLFIYHNLLEIHFSGKLFDLRGRIKSIEQDQQNIIIRTGINPGDPEQGSEWCGGIV